MERNLVLHQGPYIQHSCSTNQAFMLVPTSEVGSKETDEKADEVLKLDIWTVGLLKIITDDLNPNAIKHSNLDHR